MKILPAIILFAVTGCILGACPAGWLHHGDFCYFISKDLLNWMSARNSCISKGGYLAEPKTKIEADYLKRVASPGPNVTFVAYWLGGSDETAEGQWTWMHSNELFTNTYTDWFPSQPNNDNNENCLDLYSPYSMFWNDHQCAAALNYICEQKLSRMNLGPVVPINIG